MPGKRLRIRKAYQFFCEAETEQKAFTPEDIANVTGWKIGTVKSYISKKWHFILEPSNGGYRCKGVCKITEDAFVRLHAQRIPLVGDLLRAKYTPTVDALIDKSREAALLAIQIYNNPLLSFRAPGYIVQIVIAFTSLFHAIFERDGIEYWYSDDDGNARIVDGDKKYWELLTCLKKYYREATTPETENLRLIIGLRNKIEHRFMTELEIPVSGFCQAALLNYERILVSEFGNYFSLRNNVMLALQLVEFSEEIDEALRSIQSRQYEPIKQYIADFCNPLADEITQSSRFSFRAFLIPKIGNHASSSDVAIEFIKYDPENEEDVKQYEKQIALIREKKVQVADQGKHLPTGVIQEVEKRTGIKLSIYVHTQAWRYYKVRTSDKDPSKCNTKYCQFSDPFGEIIYTDAWIDFLAKKIQDPDELKRIRAYRVK